MCIFSIYVSAGLKVTLSFVLNTDTPSYSTSGWYLQRGHRRHSDTEAMNIIPRTGPIFHPPALPEETLMEVQSNADGAPQWILQDHQQWTFTDSTWKASTESFLCSFHRRHTQMLWVTCSSLWLSSSASWNWLPPRTRCWIPSALLTFPS